MDANGDDLVIKPLLLIGGQSTRMKTRKELLPFPDNRLSFEHSLETLFSAIKTISRPSKIYISLHDKSQLEATRFRIEDPFPTSKSKHPDHDHDHDHDMETLPPELVPIYDQEKDIGIGPAASLLAAHSTDSKATWLILGCNYPLLTPTALQQLILEYKPPITCFVNEAGIPKTLISIWSPEALEILEANVENGKFVGGTDHSGGGLDEVVSELGAKLVVPLRPVYVLEADTREEWDGALEIIRDIYPS